MANKTNSSDKDVITLGTRSARAQIMYDLELGRIPDHQRYLDIAIYGIRCWWKDRFYGDFRHRNTRLEPELRDLLMRITPALEEELRKKVLECQKKHKMQVINVTTAKALISSVLDENGIQKYDFITQKYRLKVRIPLPTGRHLVIPIKYKEIHEKIDHIVPAVKHVMEMEAFFGKDLCIG